MAQLAEVKELAPLHRLLNIFAREMYAAYLAFASGTEAKAFMAKHTLEHGACERKMRLLSLVSLAQAKKELSYGAIAKELQVGEGEVEGWVMDAISSGLLVAKMDQMRQVVAVSVCLEREFGETQWEELQASMKDWHEQISSLIQLRTAGAR